MTAVGSSRKVFYIKKTIAKNLSQPIENRKTYNGRGGELLRERFVWPIVHGGEEHHQRPPSQRLSALS
jgi:hypothetical protein